jgi:hypothetical protein
VKKQKDERDIHFAIGRVAPDWKPMGSGKKLSVQERRENRNRWIDNAEREIALIRQGIGKWPESTVDGRMEGLRFMGGFYLDLDVPEVANGTREDRLEYVEQRLKRYREEVNEMAGFCAESSTGISRGARSWWLLVAAVWCVVLTLADFREEWIYDLSKWALCGVCGYTGFRFWKEGSRRVLVPLGIMAVIFNPFAPIRFGDAWKFVDALAGATFFAVFMWDVGWIWKAWKNRKMIGLCALIVTLACFTLPLFVGAYLDSKNGGPERRAAELKVRKEKADAQKREKLMKSIFGDDYEEQINRKIYGELQPPPANSLLTPGHEPVFHDSWKAIDSADTNGDDAAWYPGKK